MSSSTAFVPATDSGSQWRSWPSLTFKLRRLPAGITTEHIYNSFAAYGNICFIEIFEDRGGKPSTDGRVRFEPPFDEMPPFFYSGRHALKVHGSSPKPIYISLEPPPQGDNETIRSKTDPRSFYPARLPISASSIDFGPKSAGSRIMIKNTVHSLGSGAPMHQIKLDADFSRKRSLSLVFPFQLFDQSDDNEFPVVRIYKAIIDIVALQQISISDKPDDEGNTLLLLALNHPPVYYFKVANEKANFEARKYIWTNEDQWARASHIITNHDTPQDFSVGLFNRWDSSKCIDIGRLTTLRVSVKLDQKLRENLCSGLSDLSVRIKTLSPQHEIDNSPCILGRENVPVRNEEWYPSGAARACDKYGLLSLDGHHEGPDINFFPFPIQYQLEVCISRGVLSEFSLTQEFFSRLKNLDPVKAQWILEYFADEGKFIENPMDIFTDELADMFYPSRLVPNYCAVVRKAVVTPTGIYYSTPSVEASNRVIRHWQNLQDRFLRVQFTDEYTRGRLQTRANLDLEHYLFKRVFLALMNGIQIGDRHYKFLAFGNSQIRESAVYFFAETDHVTCEGMRAWMGDFKHIRVVAKYAARLGQCFSTTREIRGITTPNIVLIADIERDGFCFTDGVGKISPFLARVILEEMGLDTEEVPSAVQFRMGGCKGVLAVWPDAKGMEVHVRKSQEKFRATFNGLEIIRCSKTSAATLNRQIIALLTCLGVPASAVLKLLESQMKKYQDAMGDRWAAADLLIRHVDENHTSLVLRESIEFGFMYPGKEEPFVATMLQLWRAWSMKLLREKARIVVEKGAFVLGCVDEAGVLRGHCTSSEGQADSRDVGILPQIFLQVPDPDDPECYQIITGVCILGRNPSLHPGDIRVVEAVDHPQLHHLKDVVVFPSKGDRDVPGMLSGGDLDGDDFFVIWDETLIPKEWNHPPMATDLPQPQTLDRDVRAKDLVKFFVKYIRNDCLPLIATAHLCNADYLHGGAKNPKCLKLAALHSQAVDYVKTGEAVEFQRDLRARKRPHFMGNGSGSNTYHSSTTLGQVFDKIQDVTFQPLFHGEFDRRILKKFPPLFPEMLRTTRQIKTRYDTTMRRLMAKYGVRTEFEIWGGFPLTSPRVGSSYKQSEDIGRDMGLVKQSFREEIYKAAGGKHFQEVGPFVAAMYQITEEEIKITLHRRKERHGGEESARRHTPGHGWVGANNQPLVSFPWIFHWELGILAHGPIKKVKRQQKKKKKQKGAAAATDQGNKVDKELLNMIGLDVKGPEQPVQQPAENQAEIEQPVEEEKEFRLEDVGFSMTSDGRALHRGEILHVFDSDLQSDYDESLIDASTTPAPQQQGESPQTELNGVRQVAAIAGALEHTEHTEMRFQVESLAGNAIQEDPFAAIFSLARRHPAWQQGAATSSTKTSEIRRHDETSTQLAVHISDVQEHSRMGSGTITAEEYPRAEQEVRANGDEGRPTEDDGAGSIEDEGRLGMDEEGIGPAGTASREGLAFLINRIDDIWVK